MLSGFVSQRTNNSRMLIAETAALSRIGFVTGAALLETLGSNLRMRGQMVSTRFWR